MLKEIVDLKSWVNSGDVSCSDLNTKTTVCKAVSLHILEGPFQHEDLQDLLLILQDIGRAGVAFTEFIISEEFLQMIIQEAVQYLKQECKTEKSDEMYVLMEQFFDAINILSESSAEVKASLVQKFCQLYLDSLLQNEAADFRHRLEILRSMNVLLEDAPCSIKEALLSSQFIKPSLKKLSTLLNEIGDYEFQVCISECLFRIIPKKVRDQTISTVFKNQARRKDFLAIRDNEFETDCRIFLNKLNASLKKSNRVFSVPCNKAWLGDKELHKPDDPNYETFWVDFNAGSERLTVFCGSYNSSEMSSEDMWETLTVWKDDVHSFNVKKIKEVKVVNILFSKMVSDIYPSQQDVSGRSVRLQFDADCHVENALESTFGLEGITQKVSSASTPLVINKDESSQELQDEEIPCTPVSSVYRRKVSVPDVSMPILLSPTGSISSKISEPVSAIRINFSKTPSAYTSKSKAEKVFQTPTVPANKPKQRVKTPVVTVTPPSKSKKKTSTVQTAEVVGKRMNVGLKYDKTLASNNRKASLPELPIQSSNVDVESIPDSCPVEDGKSVSLETSQDVDARIGMSVQSVEEKDKEKYPLSSNEVVEIHTAHDEETSLNSDEHINKQNTKKETQKELKQGFNLSVSKPEKTEKSKPPKTSNSKEEYCNLLSQEYDTIYQVMNNEELHINDTDDFQVLESFHEAQKSNTKSNTKISVLQKEESRKIITNKDKEKILKLEQSEKKLSNIETNISIGQDKKSKINGKCRAAENQTKLEMTDNNYDTKNGKPIITKNAVTKENGYNLVSPNPVIINIDIDDAERNFDFNDDIQVQESFPEPNKKSTKNNGKCQKKQKKSNEYKLLKDKHEQRDESDCDFYSNSGKENIDVNVIENVTSKTKGTKKGGKEPKTSSKLNKKARKVESKDGLSEAFEHATNSFVSVDLEDCLEKKNNKHFEERIGSKIGEKASSNKKRIKSLLEKDPDLNKDLETSSSKLRHNESRDNLTCFTSKDNSFTAEQLHSSWNEELPFSAPDIKKQAKYNKEETFNLQEMEEFDDDNMVCIEINDSTTVVKNNTLLNKFEEYDDYELVIEDDNKFPKQVEFVMPEKYKVVCNSNKKCKQIEKVESPDFEFSDQDDAVPCLVNKIEQDKPKLTSVDKTVKEPKGNKNRKKSGKDSHDSSDIGTKDTIKREQSKQKKKGIQKEKLNRKKSIDPEIIVEDEESDNDLQANSSYKFTCRKLPKCTVFEDSGINVDDETLEVTIPDSLTVGLPSNNEVEAKNVGEKGKAKKRAKGKPINIKECDFNICERQELNVEISDDDERHKSKITPSVSKLYVAEKLHEDVEKDDSPVPSHILIENTNEVTKVRDTVNNRKVPISGKVRTDRMSKIGKYALRKRNKEKLKEAFKVSDTEDEILSTQSSNIDRVNEQLQLTPDNITSYTPDDITSYTPNNKDQSTTFEILENKDKTVSLSDKPKQYGLNKRKSDCAITQNRKFFHSNSLSQTKNSGHYTTTTVQKIDSSSCFGFESPRDDHRTDKSQNSKRSLLLLMSYSQSDTLLPCEKGDAGSDPYDFEAECNRQKGFKTSKVLQKKGSAKSKQQPVMSKTKVKDDIVKKTKKKIANLYEHEALTTMTLFNDASMINKKTKKERDNNKSSLVYNEEGLSPDFPLFNNEIDTYQMKATKAPKKRSKGHNNKQKLYKEKKDSKICKLNNSVSFKDECDDKKQRKMQKEVEFYPGDIEETIDSDQLDPTNLQSVVFDEVSLKKISKRLSNMTSDDKSKATKELDNENSSDSQEVRIGNILNQSKLKSNCTSMPIDIDIGVEPAGSLDSQSPVHIQLKDSCRKKKKESRKKKVEVCSDEEIDNAVLTSGPTKETNSILENFSSICKKIVESNKDQVEEEEDNCYNSKEDEVLKKSNLATKIGRETPYVLTRKSQKTPTTPGNIRKLYRSLDISVMQTPKTPASVYSDMDQIPLNLSGIFSSQKSFLLDSGDEKEEELKINKEVNKKGHTKKKDKKNEIEKHEVTYSPSSAISKILSRSLASFDLDEKEALDTADENPTLSLEDSREFQTEEINRNKKKILKSGGLISGPSTTIRPSKSSLKRKYSAIMTSDLESSQDDDDLDKAYIPRKLFREQKYMVEEQMYSSDMVSDRSSEILSDVDPTTEVSTLLKAFGIDVQRHIGEKRHQLDSLTKSVLKSTQKQMNTVWTMQQRKRSSILNKYQGNMMKELVALEKDVAVLKEAEDNALTLFKQQMKHLHQFRTEQEKRLSNLCEAQQDLEEEMKEVENQSTHQHVMVKSKLREDLSSLQKKLLLESQKEELYHMKRNLQTIFC